MWIAPRRRRLRRWVVPGLAAAVGVGVAIASVVRDQDGAAVVTLAVMLGYAALLGYRRGEAVFTVHGAYGTGRRATDHLKAAAMTGDVLVAAVVAALLVQALRGHDVTTFAWLAGLAGVTYFLSMLFLGRSI